MEFDRLAGDIVAEARHALKFLDLVAPCSIIRIGRKDRDGALLGSGKLSMSLEQFIGEPFVPGSGTDGKGRRVMLWDAGDHALWWTPRIEIGSRQRGGSSQR